MAKRGRPDRRKTVNGLRRTCRRDRPSRRNANQLSRGARDERGLLDRILDLPHAAQIVPQLQPEVLHRVIQTCGLEDCGDLVTMATPGQLQRVFDLDLWRPAGPGLDEQLDASRFAVWLDVLMESGAAVAAEKIVGMDVDLVIAALAQHILVFDRAAVSPIESADGDEPIEIRSSSDGLTCEVGNYVVEARRTDAWDTLVSLLVVLDAEHPDYFHRAMRGCRSVSNAVFEVDGLDDLLDDREQDMFDLAVAREQRREAQGYVMPAQARAFLHSARQLQFKGSKAPLPDPIARAYFRAIERTSPVLPAENQGPLSLPAASDSPDAPHPVADSFAAMVDVLVTAGVLTQPPRAQLVGAHADAPKLARIQTLMQSAHDRDPAAYSLRSEEVAYLGNTIVAGCSVQARPFTEREASDAALATCNLGLENWPRHWLPPQPGLHRSDDVEREIALPEHFLIEHDLVSVFQVGWTVLYEGVCMNAAERLIAVLTDLRCDDRETQSGLDALRVELERHWRAGAPWRARNAFEVIAILDMPAWASLLGLIDECPVIHAAMSASTRSGTRAVSASAFEFISENSQLAAVRTFLRLLPDTLRR